MLLIPRNINFKKISRLFCFATLLLLFFKPAKAGYSTYYMQANSTKVFEFRDYNIENSKENRYKIDNKSPLQIKLLSSNIITKNNRTLPQLIRFEVETPKLWLPKTYYCSIQSQNENYSKDFDIFINVKLSRTQWLLYGLAVLLFCVILFGSVYYIFSKSYN